MAPNYSLLSQAREKDTYSPAYVLRNILVHLLSDPLMVAQLQQHTWFLQLFRGFSLHRCYLGMRADFDHIMRSFPTDTYSLCVMALHSYIGRTTLEMYALALSVDTTHAQYVHFYNYQHTLGSKTVTANFDDGKARDHEIMKTLGLTKIPIEDLKSKHLLEIIGLKPTSDGVGEFVSMMRQYVSERRAYARGNRYDWETYGGPVNVDDMSPIMEDYEDHEYDDPFERNADNDPDVDESQVPTLSNLAFSKRHTLTRYMDIDDQLMQPDDPSYLRHIVPGVKVYMPLTLNGAYDPVDIYRLFGVECPDSILGHNLEYQMMASWI